MTSNMRNSVKESRLSLLFVPPAEGGGMEIDMKRELSFLIKLPVMFCMLLMLGGCAMPFTGKNIDQVVLTTGFRDDEVFRIGTAVCSEDEYMLYLTNTQNQYEQVYGSEIWSVASENTTLEDKIKNSINQPVFLICDGNMIFFGQKIHGLNLR